MPSDDFDLIISGGTIIDGSGRAGFEADVAVSDGLIAAVGNLDRATAGELINASGLTVIPGIIDCHAHSDLTLLADPRGQSMLHQGVTTQLNGQCGLGVFPVRPEDREELAGAVSFITAPVEWTWASAEDYLDTLDRARPAYSAATLVGHGALRSYVLGFENREPTDDELRHMQDVLRESLDAGCFGLSFGFEYAPGFYAQEREVLALLEVIAERQALVSVHTRTQREGFADAVTEMAQWCREAGEGIRLQIDHVKRAGESTWGTMGELLAVIEELREGGLDIAFDLYPYAAGSRHLFGSLPPWVHAGGSAAMLQRISRPETRQRLREERRQFQRGERDRDPFDTAFDRILITDVRTEDNADAIGRTLQEIMEERGTDPIDTFLDLLIEESGHVSAVFFSMAEEDVRQALAHPLACIATDGLAFAPEGPAHLGNPHPRSYGTYPRLFGRYVREESLMPLEEAVHKCTAWPAERMGLTDRGRIARGLRADLVLFAHHRIIDTATWEEPHQFPRGIEFVIVGGKIAVEQGRQSTERYGAALRV
ncbi:MAG: D-aminoacylase [Armatimonadota bacterium]|nr:D-aminoacylase [Armatimonadota bacterium]